MRNRPKIDWDKELAALAARRASETPKVLTAEEAEAQRVARSTARISSARRMGPRRI